MSIEQLRELMPGLRRRQQTLRAELQAIADQANDRAVFLRLAETLTAFLARLRSAAKPLVSLNARESYDSWLKRFWSAKIPSLFVIAFRFFRARPKTKDQILPTVNITFCVRGVASPLIANVYLHLPLRSLG